MWRDVLTTIPVIGGLIILTLAVFRRAEDARCLHAPPRGQQGGGAGDIA